MRRVSKVMTKAEYTLPLTFDDGTYGELSIADRLFGLIFEPLKIQPFSRKHG